MDPAREPHRARRANPSRARKVDDGTGLSAAAAWRCPALRGWSPARQGSIRRLVVPERAARSCKSAKLVTWGSAMRTDEAIDAAAAAVAENRGRSVPGPAEDAGATLTLLRAPLLTGLVAALGPALPLSARQHSKLRLPRPKPPARMRSTIQCFPTAINIIATRMSSAGMRSW